MKFENLDEQLDPCLEYLNATTALIEACDWDEERSIVIFEAVYEALLDVYEYSTLDPTKVKDMQDLNNLIKVNCAEKVTDTQLNAAVDIIFLKAKQEHDKMNNINQIN